MHDFLKECRHWIFDMDGTLTQAVHDFDFMRQQLDIPAGADILSYIAQLPKPQQEQSSKRLDELELIFAEQAKPAQGLYELMEALSQRSCQLSILTRNTKEVAQHSLAALNVLHHFNTGLILGRDESVPKPEPDGLYDIMAHWDITPKQCVMVGDYRHDLLAGKKAGCRTVHVHANEEMSWPELTDLKVASLTELAAVCN